ncbi:HPC2-domain-containing protein [Annulohypoxylon maeteangense]|uniref:HPC2-domain-containing protein n=1 Tax=Annulohypoxylon maeteangense TaxID=1927788 RepID=UPI00200870E3|nr:HPC2-domain-containing protein [Annulohypoxylon maeteangense]KAI0886597.1 HPC2-domain-containing protein [Annulohypoxylon maeteangense]
MAAGSSNAPARYSSSPELSDPPSMLSAPASPSGYNRAKNGGELDEIVVDPTTIRYDGSGQPMLTKDGLPRRKPGPKPGTRINKRSSTNPEEGEKIKRVRKQKEKDPNTSTTSRRRKVTSLDGEASESRSRATSVAGGTGNGTTAPSRQTKITEMVTGQNQNRLEPTPQREVKRENILGSMSNILNAEPEPPQQYSRQQSQQAQQQPARPSMPSRTSGTNYDPIRSSNYDPIRGTMSYSNPMGSPRGPSTTTGIVNRASASPSIASLVDPPVPNIISPVPSHTSFTHNVQSHSQAQSGAHKESSSMPESPNPFRKEFIPPPAPKPPTTEAKEVKETKETKKSVPPLAPTATAMSKIEIRPTSITTIGGAGSKKPSPKNLSLASSPRVNATKDSLAPLPAGPERSILDFGKAEPGSETVAPSIILNIPLNGETNKYINFMRMAEDQYGWEALHPRQAEHKARKARIAAASAALAQNDSSREGDEMSVDESDNEDSNVEMGGTSGPDKPADGKPVKKKRHFKEDEYDKDDDFVDDSELLWEEQAAASRDGFFVYSGPLVPEVEKPEAGRGDGLPKRGRGSRGGRGGTRGATSTTGRGRGGGPGSRGGVVRKPRMTKADKAQMDREKAEREATLLKSATGGSYNVLHPGSPQFAGL